MAPPLRSRQTRSGRTAFVVLAALFSVVGCSTGGSDAAVDSSSETTVSAAQVSDAERYCELAQEIDYAGVPGVDFATATDEEIGLAFQAFVNRDDIQGWLAEMEQVAPAEIKAHIDVMIAAAREVAETADISVYERPEFQQAQQQVLAWELSGCPWRVVDPPPDEGEVEPDSGQAPQAGDDPVEDDAGPER